MQPAVLLRVANPEIQQLFELVFSRYPHEEWASFARFGWREIPAGLVLTLAAIDAPTHGDVLEEVPHVAIMEPYTLRTALAAEHHALGIGVIHSHPEGGIPAPSPTDDDMDRYYANYFTGFAPNRPYVSLIVSKVHGETRLSGRVWWRGAWLTIERLAAVPLHILPWKAGRTGVRRAGHIERVARFAAAFGGEAAQALRAATVAVVGAGGTGSAAIEVLARAGVGNIIIVDPDIVDQSNLERIHGSLPTHATDKVPKAHLAREHVRAIDPTIRVNAFVGALPQREIVDAVVTADVVLGCTDQQHSRLALSDLATRYLVPTIDCGVALEGSNGQVSGQVIQLVRFLPSDPCVLCRKMTMPARVAQELMSPKDQAIRQTAREDARRRGETGDAYWHDLPQLNTVGYLTTTAGALAAGYAIGWVTRRFDPPFARLQMNMTAPLFDITDTSIDPEQGCQCSVGRGHADQGAAYALISAPPHWPPPLQL